MDAEKIEMPMLPEVFAEEVKNPGGGPKAQVHDGVNEREGNRPLPRVGELARRRHQHRISERFPDGQRKQTESESDRFDGAENHKRSGEDADENAEEERLSQTNRIRE